MTTRTSWFVPDFRVTTLLIGVLLLFSARAAKVKATVIDDGTNTSGGFVLDSVDDVLGIATGHIPGGGSGSVLDLVDDNDVDDRFLYPLETGGPPQGSPGATGGAIVPEPSTFVMAALGFVALLAYAWRRRKHPASSA